MPRKTIKVTGEERDAPYDQVRNHLAALGDVFVAMECQKDYATAERLSSSTTSAGRGTTTARESS